LPRWRILTRPCPVAGCPPWPGFALPVSFLFHPARQKPAPQNRQALGQAANFLFLPGSLQVHGQHLDQNQANGQQQKQRGWIDDAQTAGQPVEKVGKQRQDNGSAKGPCN